MYNGTCKLSIALNSVWQAHTVYIYSYSIYNVNGYKLIKSLGIEGRDAG